MKIERNGVLLDLVMGDITCQADIEAVVNAANAELLPGGGVAGAIHRAAGPGLAAECRPLAPIRPGEAVITGAHNLPNRYVIHTLGPVYGSDEPADEILGACYRNSLKRAEEKSLGSVAFPAISTGVFGYPVDEAAQVSVGTVIEETESLSSLRLIRMVFFSDKALEASCGALREVSGER